MRRYTCTCELAPDGAIERWCPAHARALRNEIEACARIASNAGGRDDCDDRGSQDPETGEVPCAAENRGEVCVCGELNQLAFDTAKKIRERSTTTV